MNEREVQDQLYPHSRLEVQGNAPAPWSALKRAVSALTVIAEGEDLPAALAKNTLEDIRALTDPVTYIFTYDHAGPDY